MMHPSFSTEHGFLSLKSLRHKPMKFHLLSELHPQKFSGRYRKDVHSENFTLHSKINYLQLSILIYKLVFPETGIFPP